MCKHTGCTANRDEKTPDHFKGKDAIHHIAEVQAEGIVTSTEIHGAETPGFLFALTDAARDTAVAITALSLICYAFSVPPRMVLTMLTAFGAAWLFWKAGRACWLSWARLERLHRVMDQERYEIEVHRDQEKEELKELYRAKGFQGKLLDDVIDVLMADGDRLLRVMLEEELGFRLEENEHPLIQGLGAGLGALLAGAIAVSAYYFGSHTAVVWVSAMILALASYYYAWLQKNAVIPAIVWNLGIGAFSYFVAYYILKIFI